MENSYVITGGRPLKGEVVVSGAKNIALKVIIAALLFDGKVVLKNIPKIGDVEDLLELINSIGVTAKFTDKNTVEIESSGIKTNKIDLLHASKIRASFLLFAPLLHRFQSAEIPNPGGCRLGARSIDRTIEGMISLGVELSYDSDTGYYKSNLKNRPKGNFRFKKPSHTGTELMIMLAVFADGIVNIENAAMEPEIDDFIKFLNEAGAKISREGTMIRIEGVSSLKQDKPFSISGDKIEAATFAILAIATHGEITVSKIPENYIISFNKKLTESGAGVENLGDGHWRYFYQDLKPVNIETAPYPGFVTDWQPLFAILMTQAVGKSIIHERIFENRFSYVEELKKLGGKIEFIKPQVSDPQEFYHFNFDGSKEYNQAIEITGPQNLHGGVLEVLDLRAGATLAIAALIAGGESYVKGVHHIDRGYENFVEKIQGIGGEIRRI